MPFKEIADIRLLTEFLAVFHRLDFLDRLDHAEERDGVRLRALWWIGVRWERRFHTSYLQEQS